MRRAGLTKYLFGSDANRLWPVHQRSFPDGILVLPAQGHRVGRARPRHQRRIMLVDLKYTSDTRYEHKLEEIQHLAGPCKGHAKGQHEALHAALHTSCGTHCDSVVFVPILLGYGGTIYTEHTLGALQQLGLDSAASRQLAEKLVLHAATSAHNVIGTRRMAYSFFLSAAECWSCSIGFAACMLQAGWPAAQSRRAECICVQILHSSCSLLLPGWSIDLSVCILMASDGEVIMQCACGGHVVIVGITAVAWRSGPDPETVTPQRQRNGRLRAVVVYTGPDR